MAYFGDNGCHAWGCANHQGTLHAGYNVSSVTDNGTGDATFNFTTNSDCLKIFLYYLDFESLNLEYRTLNPQTN